MPNGIKDNCPKLYPPWNVPQVSGFDPASVLGFFVCLFRDGYQILNASTWWLHGTKTCTAGYMETPKKKARYRFDSELRLYLLAESVVHIMAANPHEC
jgi:hypothetical protein